MPKKGKGRRRETISARAKRHTEAINTLKRQNVKRGPQLIGETRFLHPSKRGMRVLREQLAGMLDQPKDATFTYSLKVKDAKGNIRRSIDQSLVLPTKGERIYGKKYGITRQEQIMFEFDARIRKQIFESRPTFTSREYQRYSALLKKSKAGARAYLNDLLKEKGVTFQVEIYRQI